jgi:hypothetical protein
LKFPKKPLKTFSKDCHVAFSLSFNTASNCWSLKFFSHLSTNKHVCSYFLESETGEFSTQLCECRSLHILSLYKILHKPQFNM